MNIHKLKNILVLRLLIYFCVFFIFCAFTYMAIIEHLTIMQVMDLTYNISRILQFTCYGVFGTGIILSIIAFRKKGDEKQHLVAVVSIIIAVGLLLLIMATALSSFNLHLVQIWLGEILDNAVK